jgi:uncharacterized membrane protein/Mg-chelatase subunit ChlD
MTFGSPAWLLLAIPLALVLARWPLATRPLRVLRVAALIALLLALARLAVILPSRQGTVIVVADRSESMPREADARQREIIRDLESSRGSSQVGVVSFGRKANVESTPDGGRFTAFQGEHGADASNLRDGLDAALGLIAPDASGRIVVVSDGRWSGREPATAALAAADRGVAVDYRLLERPAAGDTAFETIDAPSRVSPGEAFLIAATVRSPVAQEATIVLRRGATIIAEGSQKLLSGSNRLTFRDRAGTGGVQSYTAEVRVTGKDPRPENNAAHFLVGVDGPKPVLVVPGASQSHFGALLAASGVALDVRPRLDWTLEELSHYSGVVLENAGAEVVGSAGMQTLAAWVKGGGALMVTGGESSFAAGGYFHSPLDPVLPVSMEMRRDHRKLDLSIVIAMDRSGSMAMPAGGGKTKMDLANLAAVQVVDLLGPRDEVGILAVDSAAHVIADLKPLEGRTNLRNEILSVQSAGGGIFIYEALSNAATMMVTAGSETRHIILFADAADSEEEGDYKTLVDKCVRSGITISVVGLGTTADSDATLLQDIARRGHGRCYFTADPAELPRIFAQDTFVVSRSAFVHDVTPVHPTPALLGLTGRTFPTIPNVGGYNLTYVRPGATPAVLTDDEYHAPLVAAWQVGLGRVLAFTGEVDGKYSGPLAGWSDAGVFHSSLVRWIAGASTPLGDELFVRQRIENGAARIELHLDPERVTTPITQPPHVVTVSGRGAGTVTSTSTPMQWVTPDLLVAEVPLHGVATSISTVALGGALEGANAGHATLPPVCAPYSPEHAPADDTAGRTSLERLARLTGGKERVAPASIWRDLPKRRREVPLRGWLLALAMVLLLIETMERRMGWLAGASLPRLSFALPRRKAAGAPSPASPPPGIVVPPKEAVAPSVEEPPHPADDLVSALKRAGDRAKERTTRS